MPALHLRRLGIFLGIRQGGRIAQATRIGNDPDFSYQLTHFKLYENEGSFMESSIVILLHVM